MVQSWQPRAVPEELVVRYRENGWWSGESLGSVVATGLERLAATRFSVWSQVHPWHGTFADLDRQARSLATALQERGVRPGDVVVMHLPNWAEAATTFYAAAYTGAVIVPIVHFYGVKEVDYILGAVQPDVVVTADRFGRADFLTMYDGLLATHGDRPWLVAGDGEGALPSRAQRFSEALSAAPLAAPANVDPGDPAVIGFTSGTTRDPKGVIHSHETILCEARQLDSMGLPGPPNLVGTPVGHFMGMAAGLLVPVLREREVHLIDAWDPSVVLRLMLEEGLSIAGAAPFFLMSLLDHPDCTPEHVALMPSSGLGGSAVPVAVTERATRLGIKVYRAYGSTEHPSITTSFLDEPEVKRLTTDGHPLPGVEMRLDEEGQIHSRGPDLCLGYTDAELTATVFDDEGWYATGDIGVVDDDGYLTITDRISDVIIRGGENISAQEVEEQLLKLDAIGEVAVVAAPDVRLGEHAAAIIRLRPGAEAPTLGDLRTHLESVGLARQKWPESVHVVEDFPRTASGKVQKFQLRRRLRESDL